MTTTVPEAFKAAVTTWLREIARISAETYEDNAVTRRRIEAIEVLASYVSALPRDDARFEALYTASQACGGKAGPQADYYPGGRQKTYVAHLAGTNVPLVEPSESLDRIVSAAVKDVVEHANGEVAKERATAVALEAETQKLRNAQEDADELHGRIEAETLRANLSEERAARLEEQIGLLRAASVPTLRPRSKPPAKAAA